MRVFGGCSIVAAAGNWANFCARVGGISGRGSARAATASARARLMLDICSGWLPDGLDVVWSWWSIVAEVDRLEPIDGFCKTFA